MQRKHQNPWKVESLDDFTFICCPECTFKSKTESSFQDHALDNHPQCLVFFSDSEGSHELQNENTDIKEEPSNGISEDISDDKDVKDLKNTLELDIKEEEDHTFFEYNGFDDDFEPKEEDDDENDEDFQVPLYLSEKKVKRSPRKIVKKEKDTAISKKFPCEYCGQEFDKASKKRAHWKTEHVDSDGNLLCKDCPLTFKDQNLLRRHIYFKHTSLHCEECDKSFTKNVYKKHMETVHADKNDRKYQCDQCSYTSYAMKYIYDHKSTVHYNEKDPVCKICDKKFASKALLKNHNCGSSDNSPKKEEIVTCPKCDQDFRAKTFVMHYRRVHGGYPPGYENRRKYMCDQCSAEFLTDISLKRHIALTHEAGPIKEFRCDTCAQDFTGFRYLLIHFRHVHKDIPPEYKDLPQFICDQCPDIFLSEAHLKGHISRKHSKKGIVKTSAPPKKYVRKQCPHCEKTFGGYNPLQEHILVKHENNTPHQCDQCPRKFGLSHTLRVHKQYVHTKVRCEVCNEEVCNSFVLKRHKAAVHGLVPSNALKCQLCPMFFHAKKSLQNHMEKKHS